MRNFPKSIIYKLVHEKRGQLEDWEWYRFESPKRDKWIEETEEKLKETYPHIWDWYHDTFYISWSSHETPPPIKPINII